MHWKQKFLLKSRSDLIHLKAMEYRVTIMTIAAERAITYVQANLPVQREETILALQHVLQQIKEADAHLALHTHILVIDND